MAKLKNIIRQLSQEDFEKIYQILMDSNAEKSAYLLKFMHQQQFSDEKIMQELDVNPNAYYTLRSRLNQKIEEYLLSQIESPRTDLLRKVANINEIIFTKKRTIAITTLKKLEKELINYDLSYELTQVYKALRKLSLHSEESFNYSQAYNKNVAYMLSVDKVEGMLTEYFKKYGNFLFSDNDYDREELSLTNQEIIKICKAYPESHRLYIYQSCVGIFHRLFVEPEGEMMPDDEIEPIEDIFNKMERIFGTYTMDASYFHLNVLLDFLRLEYYNHYRLYRKAEKYFDEVNDTSERLLTSYNAYTYPSRFLLTKLERHNRMGTSDSLYAENEAIFADFEPDPQDVAQYTIYMCYRALSCYHVKRYDQAAKWINQLLDTVSLKKYPYVYLEVKLLLSIQYCLMRESDLLAQLINSIQRQIRQLGKETCIHVVMMVKILKASMQSSRSDKEGKIRALLDKLRKTSYQGFSVTTYVKADDDFVARLSA